MAKVDEIAITELERYALERGVCAAVIGMMGCEPCKHLLAQLKATELALDVDLAYCALRPSHFRAMKEAGALDGAPTTFVYRDGLEIATIPGGPMTGDDLSFMPSWTEKLERVLRQTADAPN